MARRIANARYFPWDGGSLFVGTSGVVPVHAHQAIQVCFLFDGLIRLRAKDDAPWVDYGLAVVPARQPHAMDGAGVLDGAVIFIEPETREGRALTGCYPGGGIAPADRALVAAALPQLRSAVLSRRGREEIVVAARGVVQALTRDSGPAVMSDERIIRAVTWINGNLGHSITLAQVAAVAHLSPSRFRHLFAEQTGTGLRPYILWRRFVSVWEHTMRGASLSTAAHAAGFADSAHLTRTCRRMMGIPPSLLDVSGSAASDE